MLWIRDVLIQIRICGSVPQDYGSGRPKTLRVRRTDPEDWGGKGWELTLQYVLERTFYGAWANGH